MGGVEAKGEEAQGRRQGEGWRQGGGVEARGRGGGKGKGVKAKGRGGGKGKREGGGY